jgi:hypothetical protein
MTLLHPWLFAAGAAAVSLPVAVHFLTRPRPVKMPLSTIRFVMEAIQQKRSRYRLRDWIVLMLRAAAVMLLAWGFARPMMGAKPLVHVGDAGKAVRVVLLDSSASMAATSCGTSAFERARATAEKYLEYQSDLRADLLLAAAKPSAVFDEASMNFGALRDALRMAKPRPERLDVTATLNKAGDVLAKVSAPDVRRELVIVADFQRSSWASADFSAIPKETLIQFESVAAKETPGNLAILNVSSSGKMELGRPARVDVEVGNYSASARDVQVEVKIGEEGYSVSGNCPPRIKTTLSAMVTPRAAGWIKGLARIIGADDALPEDDSRHFVMNVSSSPVYALITRESAKPRASSSHFLERALAPMGGERVVRINPAEMSREKLAGSSLIVLDHPGKLNAAQAQLLAVLMRHGEGMLYVASENDDAANLKLISDAAGADLKMPVEFAPSRGGESVFVAEWKRDQAPFDALGEEAGAVIAPLRFAGTLVSHRLATGLPDDILATYSDRSAMLVISACAAGNLAVLNVDLTRSDLASSPVFVPLVGEIAARLTAQRGIEPASACGESAATFLPSEAAPAAGLHAPVGILSEDATSVLWRMDEAPLPGVSEVKRGEQTVFATATGIPASEADLAALDPAVLKTRLASGRHVSIGTLEDDEPADDTAWAWAMTACAGCMLGELVVLKLLSA